jgi:hypothetical protein
MAASVSLAYILLTMTLASPVEYAQVMLGIGIRRKHRFFEVKGDY